MLKNDHDYLLRFHRENGDSLGLFRVTPDWEPAREWTRFRAVRQGRNPATLPGRAESIHPVWDTTLGEPFLDGFRISVACEEGPALRCRFPNRYFSGLARGISTALVEDGRLKEGDTFRYLTVAVPKTEERDAAERPRFTTAEVDPPLPIRETPIGRFEEAAVAAPGGEGDGREIPVFVPEPVLREIRTHARAHAEEETGGVLVGVIHRDRERPEAFVEVCAQIPARETIAKKTRLTFTPETWAVIRDARATRPEDELMVGWWHSHPVGAWCADCPQEKKEACRVQGGFFSEDDRALHRAVFPQAFCVALVVNVSDAGDEGDGTSVSCFGWDRGRITSRGFAVLRTEGVSAGTAPDRAPARGEEEEA
ncbi:MAG: hypothetical protein GF328_13795 [Candidatus Latescibacteria bacterium]|nr:hypothetical protein [Candidatus Latescibacterota bacterium]